MKISKVYKALPNTLSTGFSSERYVKLVMSHAILISFLSLDFSKESLNKVLLRDTNECSVLLNQPFTKYFTLLQKGSGQIGKSNLNENPASYFRSKDNGLWNSPSSWETSDDGTTNWIESESIPGSEASEIVVRNGHTITLNAATSARMLRIEAGGTLDGGGNTSGSSGYQLTIHDDGTPASDFDIHGTFILYGHEVAFNNTSASATIYTGGLVRVDNNIPAKKSDEFAKSWQVNFNNGAIFQWNTTTAFSTSNAIYFPNAGENTIPYFVISKEVTVGSSANTTFNGLLQINAKTTFTNNSTKVFRNGVCGSDSLIANNNDVIFLINGNNAILGGARLIIKTMKKALSIEASVTIPKDSIVTIIRGVSEGALESNVDNNKSGNTLNVIGTLDMTDSRFVNTNGKVQITGKYQTSHSGGFSGTGSSIPSGIVTINPNSTIEFYRNGAQSIISRDDYSNIILRGSGIKTPSSAFSPNGTITIKENAIFDCTEKNIGDINTNLTMADNSRLIVGTTGTRPSMEGAYNLNGGVIEFASKSQTPQTIRNGVQYFNIEVTGADSIKNGGGGNVLIKNGGSFIIKKGGKFTIVVNSIKGVNSPSTAFVKVENGGVFNSSNIGGFNGRTFVSLGDSTSSVDANINDIQLDSGSTVVYSRSDNYAGDGSQPITTGNFTYQNLTLSGTGNKIAPFKTNLPINGDFTVMGAAQFVHDSSTVTFINATAAQNINASGVTYPPVFYNLSNQNTQGLNINDKISVKSELTLGNSSKLNLSDSIRLISDNDQTASVAPVPEGTNAAIINYLPKGAFVVERYIPNHPKAWQLLSVPTKGSTIKQSWQNNQANTPGRGINITGPFTDWEARGFDKYSPAPSMKTYDPATNSYTGIPNTTMPIENPNGYFVFVRGDRSANDINSSPTEVTLQTSGMIYAPTPSSAAPPQIIVQAGKYAMIGNPYASSISFSNLNLSNNFTTTYYIWDPRLTNPDQGSAYGLGAYKTVSGGAVVPGQEDDGGDVIQSGQAFFVYNPETIDQTVTFSEQAKTSASQSVFRTHTNIPKASAFIRTNLFIKGNNSENILIDGNLELFGKSFSNQIDKYDAKKMMNSSGNIAIHSSEYPLAIERRMPPSENDTTFFELTGITKQNYVLEISTSGMKEMDINTFLHDIYLNNITLLQQDKSQINFSVNGDKNSYAINRFFITYKAIPKPFLFSNESATPQNESVLLSWEVNNQNNVIGYAVEKGRDTLNFRNLVNITPVAGANASYQWRDYPQNAGWNYYRFAARLSDSSIILSKIIKADVSFKNPSILFYPNPVTKNNLRLKLTRMKEGKYQIRLIQQDGKYVYSQAIHHNVHSNEYKLHLPHLAPGIYQAEVVLPDGRKEIEQIFIKK